MARHRKTGIAAHLHRALRTGMPGHHRARMPKLSGHLQNPMGIDDPRRLHVRGVHGHSATRRRGGGFVI
jgi:hypothetical protein